MRRVQLIINGKRQADIMAKAGRKPRQNVNRYPHDGSIVRAERGETEAEVMATAMMQRLKAGATPDNFRAHEWECPLGQLRMRAKVANDDGEGLSAKQYDAIKRYILARHIYRASQGFPVEHPKSIAAELVSKGIDVSRAPEDDETTMRKRAAYASARSALLADPSRGAGWCRLVDAMATDMHIGRGELGELRMAANVLARHFGL